MNLVNPGKTISWSAGFVHEDTYSYTFEEIKRVSLLRLSLLGPCCFLLDSAITALCVAGFCRLMALSAAA